MTEVDKETGDDQEELVSKRKLVDTDTEEADDEENLLVKENVNADKKDSEKKKEVTVDGDIADVSVKRPKTSNQEESITGTPFVSGEDVVGGKELEKQPSRTSSRLFGSGWAMTSFEHVAATLGKSQPSFSKELKKEEEKDGEEVKNEKESEEEEDHPSNEEARGGEVDDSRNEHKKSTDSSLTTIELPNGKTKATLVTGEEDEETLWNGRAKLYVLHEYDGSKSSGPTKDWKECGVGILRLNVTCSGERRSRLVMRAEGTFRLLLNAPLFKDMYAEIVHDLNLRLAVLESDHSIRHYLIRFKTVQDVQRLYTLMAEQCSLRTHSGTSC